MTAKTPDVSPMQDPESQLERAFIEEFLGARGYDLKALKALPDEQTQSVLKDASVDAAGKLAEVKARAQLIDEIHSKGGSRWRFTR